MDKNKTRYWLGSLLCFLSLILLIWTEWPIKSETRNIVFLPGELQVQAPSISGTDQNVDGESLKDPLAFRDEKKVTLEWTPIIRKGDQSQIKLSFTGDKVSLNENYIYSDDTPKELSGFENLYDVFSVYSEARVELFGFDLKPAGISGQVLQEDHDIVFTWKISSNKDGLYNGVAWLYLRYFAELGGDFIDQPVSAQSFEIKVVSFLGLNSNYWRVVGVLGMIFGIYIQKKRIIEFIGRSYKLNYRKKSN